MNAVSITDRSKSGAQYMYECRVFQSLLLVIGISFGDVFANLCTDNLELGNHSMGNIKLKCPCHLNPFIIGMYTKTGRAFY